MLQHLMPLQWAEAIESLEYDSRSDKSFGMKQRPDGDIEIDEKFWEEEFHIPNCEKCDGILKPDVSTFFFCYLVPNLSIISLLWAAENNFCIP